ncbi:hypothetical protein CF326_g9646 [Tilletia indica]|nr:hypothetical protein CF326_g9646 [Tilletia indica]
MSQEASSQRFFGSTELLSLQSSLFHQPAPPYNPPLEHHSWQSPWLPAKEQLLRPPASSMPTQSRTHCSAASTDKSGAPSSTDGARQPPRPPNAWILYRAAKSKEFAKAKGGLGSVVDSAPRSSRPSERSGQREGPGKGALTRTFAEMWRRERADVRRWYEDLAEQKKIDHRQQYPDYRYRPRRAQTSRAKVQPASDDTGHQGRGAASSFRNQAEDHRPRDPEPFREPIEQRQLPTLPSAPLAQTSHPHPHPIPQLHGTSLHSGSGPMQFHPRLTLPSWAFSPAGPVGAAHIDSAGAWKDPESYHTQQSSSTSSLSNDNANIHSKMSSVTAFYDASQRAGQYLTLSRQDNSWPGGAVYETSSQPAAGRPTAE